VLTKQHHFRDAARLYEQALARAEAESLDVTQAEIECNIGYLALVQGRYDEALNYLERSRRRYATLGMPHESAIAEQEIADAYLELNLLPEAAAIYDKIIPQFAEQGMRAEQARALAHNGQVRLLLGDIDQARWLLAQAHALYETEDNAVGAAITRLSEAYLHYTEQDCAGALTIAEQAERPLAAAGVRGKVLLARWLRGDCLRALGQQEDARVLLEAARLQAEREAVPQIAQRCYASLGLLATAEGQRSEAETYFKRAIETIEALRAPLPAEEFRTAFVADKLVPYSEMVRLCLVDGSPERIREALNYVERARSRALVDMLGGTLEANVQPREPLSSGWRLIWL
jgi:tetratricopeptide (TPR) repeat protein